MSRISREPIDASALIGSVSGPGKGGLVLFLGTVRDHAEGRSVTAIDYDAHEKLADQALESVERETVERWPDVALAIVHRIGHLAVGEASVGVAAASAHRAEAFAAARFALDTLKERVPIWKKELSPDGDQWLHGTERVPSATDPEAP